MHASVRGRAAPPAALALVLVLLGLLAVAGCGGRPLRAFLLKPVTGRTHQLRVAMKSLGAPVLGDEVRTLYDCLLLGRSER